MVFRLYRKRAALHQSSLAGKNRAGTIVTQVKNFPADLLECWFYLRFAVELTIPNLFLIRPLLDELPLTSRIMKRFPNGGQEILHHSLVSELYFCRHLHARR